MAECIVKAPRLQSIIITDDTARTDRISFFFISLGKNSIDIICVRPSMVRGNAAVRPFDRPKILCPLALIIIAA